MATIGEMDYVITANASGFLSAVSSAGGAFTSFIQSVGNGQANFDNLTKSFTLLGAGIIATVAGIGSASVKMASDFDDSISKVLILTGQAGDTFQSLSDKILKLSETVPQSATQLADGLYFVQSAGFAGADAMNILQISAKAAAVGFTDTKVVADAVTSVLNAYGLSASQASNVTDQLTAAVTNGKTEYSDFAGALGQVMPIAAAAKVSFTDVFSAMSVMTKAGLDASQSATQIKGILLALEAPTAKSRDEIEALGLSTEGLQQELATKGLGATLETINNKIQQLGAVSDTTTKQVGVTSKEISAQTKAVKDNADARKLQLDQQILNLEKEKEAIPNTKANKTEIADLTSKIKDLQNQQKQLTIDTGNSTLKIQEQTVATKGNKQATTDQMEAITDLFPGFRSLTGELTLAKDGGDSFNEMVKNLNSSTGLTQKDFEELKQQDPSVEFKLLSNALGEAAIRLGNALLPSLVQLANAITPIVQNVADWINKHQQLSEIILIGAAVIGGLLVVIGPLVTLIGAVVGVVGFLISVLGPLIAVAGGVIVTMTALGIPILAIIAIITGLIIIGKLLISHWSDVGNAAKSVGGAIVNGFQNALSGVANWIGAQLGNISQWGSNLASSFVNGVINGLKGLGNAFSGALSSVSKIIQGHSPPVEGPLKDIDQWGSNVGMAWVNSFNAAFANIQVPNISGLLQGGVVGNPSGNYNSMTSMNTNNVTMNNSFNVSSDANANNLASYLAFQLQHAGIT